MDERADTGGFGSLGDVACPFVLDGFECLLTAREEDADEVHDGVRVFRRGHERIGIAHVGLDRHDLPDAAQRLQMTGEIRPPDGNPDTRAGARDGPDQMAAQKSGTAVDGYECSVVQCDGHFDVPFSSQANFAAATCHEDARP